MIDQIDYQAIRRVESSGDKIPVICVRIGEGGRGSFGIFYQISGTIEPDLSTIRFVESTPVYPEAPSGVAVPSIAVECPDYITFDGYLDLVTPDGILDEELYISFVISEDTLLDENAPINATYTTEIESFNGSFSPAGQFDGITLSGEVGSIYSGEISVLTTESDGNITLAMIEVLAEWGGDPDPECPSFE